ncbi:hypothetical protein SeMB42_g02009, partial [Synchytrium endobioticum]
MPQVERKYTKYESPISILGHQDTHLHMDASSMQQRPSAAGRAQVSHAAPNALRMQSLDATRMQTIPLRRPSMADMPVPVPACGRRASLAAQTHLPPPHLPQQPQSQTPPVTVRAGPAQQKLSLANIMPALSTIAQSSPGIASLTAQRNVEAPVAVLTGVEASDESESLVPRQAGQRRMSFNVHDSSGTLVSVIIPEEDDESDGAADSDQPPPARRHSIAGRSSVGSHSRRGSLAPPHADSGESRRASAPSVPPDHDHDHDHDHDQSRTHVPKHTKEPLPYAHATPCVEKSVPVGTYTPYPMTWPAVCPPVPPWSRDATARAAFMSKSIRTETSLLAHLGPG